MTAGEKDFLSHEGATKLADTIVAYWARRGFIDVETSVRRDGRSQNLPVFVVRSNLVRGLPPSFRDSPAS